VVVVVVVAVVEWMMVVKTTNYSHVAYNLVILNRP
jgi:hypothetical protein